MYLKDNNNNNTIVYFYGAVHRIITIKTSPRLTIQYG